MGFFLVNLLLLCLNMLSSAGSSILYNTTDVQMQIARIVLSRLEAEPVCACS